MRAFMSAIGRQDARMLSAQRRVEGLETLSRRAGILAEREARAILAESEPSHDAEGWVTAHVPAGFPEWGHAALAEALAAFVGEGN